MNILSIADVKSIARQYVYYIDGAEFLREEQVELAILSAAARWWNRYGKGRFSDEEISTLYAYVDEEIARAATMHIVVNSLNDVEDLAEEYAAWSDEAETLPWVLSAEAVEKAAHRWWRRHGRGVFGHDEQMELFRLIDEELAKAAKKGQ